MSAEIAGVGVGFGIGADIISKAVSLTEIDKEAGAHRATESEADELENRGVGMTVSKSADAEREMGLVGFFVMKSAGWRALRLSGDELGFGSLVACSIKIFGDPSFWITRQSAGHDDDTVSRDVLALVIINKILASEGFDIVLGADSAPAGRSVAVEEFFEEVFDIPHWIIEVHIDFFDDDAAFTFDFLAVE